MSAPPPYGRPAFVNADNESGVVLVHVLSILALAASVTAAILTLQDVSIDRTGRALDAAQAHALALGGETSAIVALRRDGIAAPGSDHYKEDWAGISDNTVAIQRGAFNLAIEDEQAKFNLNNIIYDGLAAEALLAKLLESDVRLTGKAKAADVARFVREHGGLSDLSELAPGTGGSDGLEGVDSAFLTALSDHVCVLPTQTTLNLNTAAEPVMAAALANPVAARMLIARRAQTGSLSAQDLVAARVILPGRADFRSDYYRVRTIVRFGQARFGLESRLKRKSGGPKTVVAVWSRKRIEAAELLQPPQ